MVFSIILKYHCILYINVFLAFLVGLIGRTFRTIFVEREEQDSRNKAVREIRKYASSKGEWPQVLIFPEGMIKLLTQFI